MVRRCSLLVLLCTAWTLNASAAPAVRAVLLEPTAPLADERELSTRLEGELAAAGFQVLRLTLTPGTDVAIAVRREGRALDPVATFAITRQTAPPGRPPEDAELQLWFSDQTEKTIVLGPGADHRDAPRLPERLAVQGVELLQARLADWSSTEPTVSSYAAPVPVIPRRTWRVTAAVGLGVMLDAASGAAALTPLGRIAYALREDPAAGIGPRWSVRLSAAGLGTSAAVKTPLRHVDVGQSFALLEAVTALDHTAWLRSSLSLGGGIYRLSVEGVTGQDAIGRSRETGSAVGALGFGLSAHPLPHWVGELTAQGLFALRPTAIESDGRELAEWGRTSVVVALTLGVDL